MIDHAMLIIAQQKGNPLLSILFLVVPMLIIIYIMSIKPQQKKQREHDELLKKLKVGDKIVTIGGIRGTIKQVRDESFLVTIAEGTHVEFSRSSVALRVDDNGKKDGEKN